MATEKRLIDANALKKQKTILWNEALGFCDCVLVEDIDEAPTVDAVEVVHGRWIPSDIDIDEHEECLSDDADFYDWECSVCHEQVSYVDPVKRRHLTKYCPNCGAKMDGDGNG